MQPPSLHQKREPTRATWLVVCLILFALHSYLALPVAGTSIPFGVAMVLCVLLFLLHPRKWSQAVVGLVALIVMIVFAGVVTGPSAEAFLGQRLLSTCYFIASLVCAIVLQRELRTWPAKTLARLFGYTALVLLIGAAIELFTPIRALSDSFREATALRGVLYQATARDIAETGMVRPMFFAQEPSILAQSIGISILVWLIAGGTDRGRALKFSLFLCAALAIVRSPILLLYYPALIWLYLSPEARGRAQRVSNRVLVAIALMLIGVPILLFVMAQSMAPRFERFVSGSDASAAVRLAVPIYLASDVLRDYPVFGIGLGGKNAITSKTVAAIERVGQDTSKLMDKDASRHHFGNTFLEFLATFGLLAGAVILYLLIKIQRRLAPGDGKLLFVAVGSMCLAGNYVGGMYFWSACALLAAAAFARRRDGIFQSKARARAAGRIALQGH